MNLTKLGLFCGMLGPPLWLALIAYAGTLRPGFCHVKQYISELAERGSVTETLMRVGAFGFTGFLYLCFAATLSVCFKQTGAFAKLAFAFIALDGLGRIGAGVFPCDPGCDGFSLSQQLHRAFATVGFVSGVLACIASGAAVKRLNLSQGLSRYSYVTGALAAAFLWLMSSRPDPAQWPGLFEHLASVLLSLWLMMFAGYLFFKHSSAAE